MFPSVSGGDEVRVDAHGSRWPVGRHAPGRSCRPRGWREDSLYPIAGREIITAPYRWPMAPLMPVAGRREGRSGRSPSSSPHNPTPCWRISQGRRAARTPTPRASTPPCTRRTHRPRGPPKSASRGQPRRRPARPLQCVCHGLAPPLWEPTAGCFCCSCGAWQPPLQRLPENGQKQ